ncbi:hypothetical protein ACG0Z5_21645 [Scandinavium sp. M-37]
MTILNSDCDLLSIPFSAATDFLDLADFCDRFAVTLIECDGNPPEKTVCL